MGRSSWTAVVRRTSDPRGRSVWHVAFLKGGAAQHTRIAATPEQAVKLAERPAPGQELPD